MNSARLSKHKLVKLESSAKATNHLWPGIQHRTKTTYEMGRTHNHLERRGGGQLPTGRITNKQGGHRQKHFRGGGDQPSMDHPSLHKPSTEGAPTIKERGKQRMCTHTNILHANILFLLGVAHAASLLARPTNVGS